MKTAYKYIVNYDMLKRSFYMDDKKENMLLFLRRIITGITTSTLAVCGLLLYKPKTALDEFSLNEIIPYNGVFDESRQMFKFMPDIGTNSTENGNDNQNTPSEEFEDYIIYTDGIDFENNGYLIKNGEISISANIEAINYNGGDIIGIENVIYQDEKFYGDVETHFPKQYVTAETLEKLHDIEYLKNNFYSVDKTTDLTEKLFDIDNFLSTDVTINKCPGPQVLIFHTHASEAYSDSALNKPEEGIVGVGDRLARELENKYGLEVLHVANRFDVIDGKTKVLGAYERMEPVIQKIIDDNPSIQLIIDLHRDGLDGNTKLITDIDGKQMARIMFFNGLSMLKDENGKLKAIDSLPNPNLNTNLALSFKLQLEANSLYPGFARKIYLKGYRFSLHMLPKSMLVEVGANTNTKEEAFNTVEPLAEIIANVVLEK